MSCRAALNYQINSWWSRLRNSNSCMKLRSAKSGDSLVVMGMSSDLEQVKSFTLWVILEINRIFCVTFYWGMKSSSVGRESHRFVENFYQ